MLKFVFAYNIAEVKCDAISQIISSEKALSLVAENAGKLPVPAETTLLPVVKNIDELKDFTSLNAVTSSVSNIYSMISTFVSDLQV